MASHLPAAQPRSILRGHKAQVHATAFVRANERLASGDAEGYVVLWDLTIMRPRAVWRAHTSAILGIAPWGTDRLITHGRDNRLVVWKIGEDDEAKLSTALPLDASAPARPEPWILHILEVNTMNFCSFAHCAALGSAGGDDLLVGVPNTLASESVDIYHLPSQTRRETVRFMDKAEKNGMVMALAMFYRGDSLTLVSAYENGLAIVAQKGETGEWHVLYKAQAHSQVILSLDVSSRRDYFLTSGADALVIKHPIPRLDDLVAISGEPRHAAVEGASSLGGTSIGIKTQPMKIVDTKHSGQQGVRVRPDGKIFVTAGWDSKARVYSAQTMKELAVLKWHTVGCYTVAFSSLTVAVPQVAQEEGTAQEEASEQTGSSLVELSKARDLTVKERRVKSAKEAHWLAVGSKDGRISLWDIY